MFIKDIINIYFLIKYILFNNLGKKILIWIKNYKK
jgi:hypothetical protein